MTTTTTQANRELVRFLGVALGLGLALQVPALFNPAFLGLGLFVMWTPALAVLVAGKGARAAARRKLSVPWPWKTMLLASVLGWFHKVVSGLGAVALGYASFNEEHFRFHDGRTTRADFVWFFPSTGEPLLLFLLHLFAMQLVGVAIAGPLMAFGEEIGWRGYLQGELVRRFGMWKGTLAVGVIWAYWHVGFMLAGHNGGGEHRVANALVYFPFHLIVVAFLYGWLTHRTKSVLPAICAHAANNSFPADKLFTTHSWTGDKLVSVVTTLALGLVVLALYKGLAKAKMSSPIRAEARRAEHGLGRTDIEQGNAAFQVGGVRLNRWARRSGSCSNSDDQNNPGTCCTPMSELRRLCDVKSSTWSNRWRIRVAGTSRWARRTPSSVQ